VTTRKRNMKLKAVEAVAEDRDLMKALIGTHYPRHGHASPRENTPETPVPLDAPGFDAFRAG
jgi:hypothetical protein